LYGINVGGGGTEAVTAEQHKETEILPPTIPLDLPKTRYEELLLLKNKIA
jgi:hypothetical protein